MGWWWSPGNSNEARPTPSDVQKSTDNAPPSPPSWEPQPDAVSKTEPSKALTRDQESERELITWLKQLESEYKENAASSKEFSTTQRRSPDDISPNSLYPTKISCRAALDYALFCQSFGGQFVNVYRYGTFRSCSNHWQDFWLCMRTRGWDKDDRERAIADHYRKKVVKYKQGPSSEDVWKMRTEPVKDAFQGDLEALEREVAEWRRQNPGAKEPWEQ